MWASTGRSGRAEMAEDFLFAVAVTALIFVALVTTGNAEVLGLFSPPTIEELSWLEQSP